MQCMYTIAYDFCRLFMYIKYEYHVCRLHGVFLTWVMGGSPPRPTAKNLLILPLPRKIPPSRLPPTKLLFFPTTKSQFPPINNNFQVITQ